MRRNTLNPFTLRIALVILTIAAYWPAMRGPFVYDDVHHIIGNDSVTFHAPIKVGNFGRAVEVLTYRLNFLFSQSDPFPYHLTNLAIHILNGFLVYVLTMGFVGEWAIVAMGIFLLHPLQVDAVAYMTGRAELLAATGILLSVWAFARGRWLLALMTCFLAVESKEHAAVIPLLWLIYPSPYRRKLAPIFVLGTVVALPLIMNSIPGALANLDAMPTTAYATLDLLGRVLWPTNLTIEHDFSRVSLIAGELSLITLAISAFFALGHLEKAWPVLWIIVLMLPHLLMEPKGYLAEHHLYSPMFAAALILTFGLRRLYAGTSPQDGYLPLPRAS